jgi:uncharacterized protein
MLKISRLFVYPVKSLGGISVNDSLLTDRGFQYDRRWMLLDGENRFMTQREYPQMALLQTSITENGIALFHVNDIHERTIIPFYGQRGERIKVQVWNDICDAVLVSNDIDRWISDRLGLKCRLVYMPDDSLRKVDEAYAVEKGAINNFSDGYPLLVLSQSSLDDLNSQMEKPIPMNRFRPNIVLSGANPYEEDEMEEFMIRGVHFFGVKLCARCMITTINQETLEKSTEPLKTLATYRTRDNNIWFGQNVIYRLGGVSLKIGDRIEVLKRKPIPEFNIKNTR